MYQLVIKINKSIIIIYLAILFIGNILLNRGFMSYSPIYLPMLIYKFVHNYKGLSELFYFLIIIPLLLLVMYIFVRIGGKVFVRFVQLQKGLDILGIIYLISDTIAIIISMIIGYRPGNNDQYMWSVFFGEGWVPVLSLLLDIILLIDLLFIVFYPKIYKTRNCEMSQ